MKKTIMFLAFTVAMSLFAAPEKFATVKIAGLDKQIVSATQLGQLTGNAMLGTLAAMKMQENPFTKFFGPAREGADVSCIFHADLANVKPEEDDLDAILDDNDLTIIYPVKNSKAEFLAATPDAIETNGVIYVEDAIEPFDDTYVLFTEDGKWAVAAGEEKFAREALKEIAFAEKPMSGDNIEIAILPSFMKLMPRALNEGDDDEADKKLAEAAKEIVKMVEAVTFRLKVGANGIDIGAKVITVPETPLAKCGDVPLKEKPFAEYPAGAVLATACEKNSGYHPDRVKDQIAMIVSAINKAGVKTDFLKVDTTNSITSVTLDIPAEIAYFKAEGKVLAENETAGKVLEEFGKIGTLPSSMPTWNAEGSGSVFQYKDIALTPSLDERYAATLPEAASKKPFAAAVFSMYQGLKVCVETVLANVPDSEGNTAGIKAILSTLPAYGNGASASICWKEGKDLNYLCRISPDEIRGISAVGTMCVGYVMQSAMSRSYSVDEIDDDDDVDDDDDDDDDDED